MKKIQIKTMFTFIAAFFVMSSCQRVAPNYAGVLMEIYGKSGKEDFSIVSGKVSVVEPGTELFQVTLIAQRREFSEPVMLKASMGGG